MFWQEQYSINVSPLPLFPSLPISISRHHPLPSLSLLTKLSFVSGVVLNQIIFHMLRIGDLKPVASMILVQVAFAGVNICYKLALLDGMGAHVLVAYRYIFAAISLGPVAFVLERNGRPRFTWTILMLLFLSGLFGGTLVQNLFIEGIEITSVTYATAIANLIPAVTFLLAVVFRFENFSIRTLPGIAKIMGTVVGLGGVTLLTFYKGLELHLWPADVDLLPEDDGSGAAVRLPRDPVVGSLLCIASCASFALWLTIQAKISEIYPCPFSSAALMCAMASVQSVVYAFCMEGTNLSAWDLDFGIRLLAVIFCGVIVTGPSVAIISWCVRKNGPLFVSAFYPLTLLVAALSGSFLLQEKLHIGTLVGSVLIVAGLYFVIWGKGREATEVAEDMIPATFDDEGLLGSHLLLPEAHHL